MISLANSNNFIIHEHNAIKVGLHYDLRINKDNTLKCWSGRYIPDIINNTKSKILLIKQPDHDISWFNFKGPINTNYGKGKLSIWDKGTYNINSWSNSKIDIDFLGIKLIGRYILLKAFTNPNHYLFFKKKE
jgi:bifunctional non-homologous end joining protein LigD